MEKVNRWRSKTVSRHPLHVLAGSSDLLLVALPMFAEAPSPVLFPADSGTLPCVCSSQKTSRLFPLPRLAIRPKIGPLEGFRKRNPHHRASRHLSPIPDAHPGREGQPTPRRHREPRWNRGPPYQTRRPPLTPEEDAAEHQRLNDLLASPGRLPEAREQRRHRQETGRRAHYPHAARSHDFEYTPRPATTRIRSAGEQVVIDFKPNPAWKPPTMTAQALTGLAGPCMDRSQRPATWFAWKGEIFQSVNVAMGNAGPHLPRRSPDPRPGSYSRRRPPLDLLSL